MRSGSGRHLLATLACGSVGLSLTSASVPAVCEDETQREYGKNRYAGYVKDPNYRGSIWDAFFNVGGHAKAAKTREDLRKRNAAAAEEDASDFESLSISCQELLQAARQGLGLKRALRLVHVTGQHDMLATCKDINGRSAVMLASMQGNVDNVDMCLQAHSQPKAAVVEGDKHGVTSLELAAWKGHYMVVDYLLQEGAKTNSTDCFGIAPLHKAVGHGQRRVVLRLLQDGSCNVNMKCSTPTAPPDYEAITTHQTALHIACRRHAHGNQVPGDRGMAQLLLNWGADAAITDIWGNTPLHYAAQAADIDMVRLLLKHGADIRSRNVKGQIPSDMLPTWIFDEPWGPALEILLHVS